MTAAPRLINFAAFQLGWFACVLGAAWGRPWLGTAIALALVGWHLSRAAHPRAELALVLAAAGIGALWDSLLPTFGWIEYPNGTLIAATAPHWMVALWMLFATTLNASLAWLKGQLWLAAGFGAVGGPLGYLAGERLGALALVERTAALVVLAIGWALLAPLLSVLAQRIEARRAPRAAGLRPKVNHA
jgi:hypothetical protein